MRALRTATLAVILLLATAAPAVGSHTHVRSTGNGACVVLAASGGENGVELPHAGDLPDSRRHPLHVNVHLGQPGVRNGEPVVWVRGSAGDLASCDGYVND